MEDFAFTPASPSARLVAATVPGVEILLITVPGPGVPAEVVLLADEMAEDPRCHVVAAGADEAGAVLITIWDGGLAPEVADGLAELDLQANVRRLTMPEGLGSWR